MPSEVTCRLIYQLVASLIYNLFPVFKFPCEVKQPHQIYFIRQILLLTVYHWLVISSNHYYSYEKWNDSSCLLFYYKYLVEFNINTRHSLTVRYYMAWLASHQLLVLYTLSVSVVLFLKRGGQERATHFNSIRNYKKINL